MANHASTCTTQLYDRRRDEVSRDEALSCWFSKNGRPEKIGAAGGRGQEWRQRARHRERYGRQRNQSSNDHARSRQRACRYVTSAARFSPHGPLGIGGYPLALNGKDVASDGLYVRDCG